MITVSIFGMDYYEAIATTKKLHSKLVEAYDIEDDELEFFAPESFIIHNGFEQTSFRLNIKVEAPYDYSDKEEEIKDIIFNGLKDVAIHLRVVFSYFEPSHEYLKMDETYPLHMSASNTVKAEGDDESFTNNETDHQDENYEETYEEPYMGDIISQFDEYVKEHPNATNEEVYQALSNIRNSVTASHHNEDDDDVNSNDQND